LIEFIVPDILLHLKDYSSIPAKDLRLQIRKDLISCAESQFTDHKNSLSHWLDLNTIPQSDKLGVSISHSQSIGGFILSSIHLKIGLDLEFIDRIQPEVIKRISSPSEIKQAPDIYRLWTAKEASFKSFYPNGPEVLSKVHIQNWQQLDSNTYTFEFKDPELTTQNLKGKGWNFNKKRLNLSICSISY
jgi:phosphopantetheinyl transferase (holo-ACP synthase)